MEAIAVILVALFFVVLLKITGKSRQARLLELMPGPPGFPIVGNSFDFMGPREKRLQVVLENDAKFPPIYKTWLGPKPMVHIFTAEHFEVVLSSPKHIQKGAIYHFVIPWLGTGLLTSKGAKWFKHRKMITPTFHFKILETFIEVFNENSRILLHKLEKKAKTREEFDIYPYITLCALDIICESAMGSKIKAQTTENSTYVNAIYELAKLVMVRFSSIWLHPDFTFSRSQLGKMFYKHLQVLHGFTKKIIKEKKEARKSADQSREENNDVGAKKKKAFLDLLLDACEEEKADGLTDEEIREEVDTFMFEGHDTTTAGITWALLLLGNHPDVQNRIVEELAEIFKDEPERMATMKDLGEMKYLERTIKEALRIYPPVPFISRKLEEDLKLDDYLIPHGTSLSLHIFTLHRDPRYFPEPERFNPDNFLPERIQERHPYAYVPFSAGPRNCIGQKFALLEEKVILSSILRKFSVEAVDKTEDLTPINELILRPKSGIKIRLTPRKQSE